MVMTVPASAAPADGAGPSSSSVVAQEEGGQGAPSDGRRGRSVHDETTTPWPVTPSSPDSSTTDWEVLPVAVGVAGGLALAGIGFAAITVARRHGHGHMAHPA
jgi:hypothetical protein